MKPINKKNILEVLALTPMQEGMLFYYLKEPGSDLYFEQLCLQMSGEIDIPCFERAWKFVVDTNEMLRTVFRWEKMKSPVQAVLKQHYPPIRYGDVSAQQDEEKKKRINRIKSRDKNEKFDLHEVPFRVTLIRTQKDRYELIISNHHILYDGWSNGIILNEFLDAYHDLCQGRTPRRSRKNRFKEYIKWVKSQDKTSRGKFWKEYLQGIDKPMVFSFKPVKGKGVKEIGGKEIGIYPVLIPREKKEQLESFVRMNKITFAAFLYGAYAILLQKYNNTDDVVFGTTVSGRSAKVEGIENIVGLFINTIPLRVRTDIDEKVIDLLTGINEILPEREKHESSPLTDIERYSGLGHDKRLFDSIMVIENYPVDLESIQTREYRQLSIVDHSISGITNYNLTVGIRIFDDIQIRFTYNSELFEEDIIRNVSNHFVSILDEIREYPGKAIFQLDILSREEKRQILYEFNNTRLGYPADKTIHDLFAAQVEQTPDNIVLVGEEEGGKGRRGEGKTEVIHFTYRELNKKSNQLAHLLIGKGLKSDVIVALLVERSVEMLFGILGILKAGGAYLPIDPDYPGHRIQYILTDSNAGILLITSGLQAKVKVEERFIGIIDISNFSYFSTSSFTLNSTCQVSPMNLAYVIYTSGTTGHPKGVMIRHRNVVNLVWGLKERIYKPYGNGLKIAMVAAYVFDASVKQIFGALLQGHGLHIVPGEIKLKDPVLLDFYNKYQIDVSDGTPLHISLLLESVGKDLLNLNIKQFIIGGEPLSKNVVARFLHKFAGRANIPGITNVYGPTECCVDSTSYKIVQKKIESLDHIPIGIPMPNHQVYILDRNMKLQPREVTGELCIAGEGVARGYLNNPELTNEKFVQQVTGAGDRCGWEENKQKFLRGVQGGSFFKKRPPGRRRQKIYKTGDLARWRQDGNIEFLGRLDNQVKIRGYRIELGEIESQLLNHDKIKNGVILARKDNRGDKYLCAYVVLNSPGKGSSIAIELRNYLAGLLPDYMIPNHFMPIDHIPLTSNGKLDGKALPEPAVSSSKDYIPPGNEIQRVMVEIWSEVLGIEQQVTGIDDNFFELGGHSLKAIGLAGRLHRAFDIEIPLTSIFQMPTIRQLSDYIRGSEKGKYREINPVEEKEYYPLSASQKSQFILHGMDTGSTAYNMTGVMKLTGEVKEARLEKAIMKLIHRHQGLRTSFEMVDDTPVQRIYKKITNFKLRITKTIKNFVRPFDLSKAPLMRIGLIKEDEKKFLFLVDMHHIISDGVSIQVLVHDFMGLYAEEELPALKLQYKDFSVWQNKRKGSSAIKKQEAYWSREFSGETPVLNLCTDFLRPGAWDFAGDILEFEIETWETEKLKQLAREEKSTLFMLLFALFYVLLSKVSSQEEILLGTPMAGRTYTDWEPIIGMFVNVLAIRNYPAGEKTFSSFLQEVKSKILLAYENQEYPFEELVKNLEISRDPGRNPLFDIMFAYQDMNIVQLEAEGLKLEPCNYKTGISKFDLTLLIREHHENLFFAFEYSTKLFREETIGRFIQYFKNIVSRALIAPQEKISGLEIISEREKHRVLFDFNRTQAKYPQDKTFYHLFADQVEKSPDTAALVYEDQCITYCESNGTANRLALRLKQRNVKPGTIAAIMVRPSTGMITALLGILKAGAVFLPIDSAYPRERIQYMLTDSNARVLVTTSDLAKNVEKGGTYEIIFEESFEIPDSYLSIHLLFSPLPSSPAYVIYTSGSTGRPKGVIVAHQSLDNLCHWHNKRFSVTTNDRAFKYANFGFDASVWEIFPYLIIGASLYVLNDEIKMDIFRLNEYFEINRISIGFLPTQICEQFMTISNCSLRVLLTGGDQLKRFVKRNYQLVNNYGPTENTVVSTSFVVEDSYPNIPIGSPIDNTCIYILDKNGNLQPIGIPGELCVSGDGLARGYLNQPELTIERFCLRQPGGRFLKKLPPWTPRKNFLLGTVKGLYMSFMSHKPYIYKTGDLARWLEQGNIEFLGRIDDQVKIRGFRIELGEIENHLLNHPYIKQAVVLTKENNQKDKYLCAYVVPKDQFLVSELRKYLSRSLPGYMIPSYFVVLDRIPITPSCKIDRKKLPEPEIKAGEGYVAPRSPIEKKLVEIWQEVLKPGGDPVIATPARTRLNPLISIDDNFFVLGGHSLKATVLVSKIYKEIKVKVPLTVIFKTPTIRGLAEFIRGCSGETYVSLEPVESKEYYTLSSAQKRLYILQQMDLESTAYNIPVFMVVEGDIEKVKIEAIFQQLIQRHESLHSSFMIMDGAPVQRVQDDVRIKVEKEGTRGHTPLPIEPETAPISSFIQPFDMCKAPLLRVGLIRPQHTLSALRGHPFQEGRENKCLLMVDMHHIISDGMSVEILIEEFTALYTGQKLPSLKLQYKDYSEWQQRKYHREELREQEAFWQQYLSGEIPQLQLPTDFARPKELDFQGKQLNFEITQKETGDLKKLALEEGTTLYMLLLSIFNVFLSKITNQEIIVVGTAVAGRRHADLEQIIGMFVNTLALINYPVSQKTFSEFLHEVNRETLQALENQDYPFEKLVEKAVLNRDTSRNPLFDVMFALQPLGFNGINIPGLSLYPYDHKTNLAKFDLMLQAVEQHENLSFTFEYRTSLFRESTIQRFIRYIKKIIAAALEQPTVNLGEMEFMPRIEKNQILFEFNNTASEYPKDESIHRLFEKEVEKRPQQTAVIYEDQSLTYCALNRRADRLAAYLLEKGVELDSSVGIMLDASLEVIIGVLAILKAGAAYLPIDPDYPRVRTDYMLADSNANVLVTIGILIKEGQEARKFQANKNCEIIFLDSFERSGFYPSTPLSFHPSQSFLAYVIYTSGSTGRPKGVMVEHRNVVRLVRNTNYIDFKPGDRILQTGALEFDASTFEIWGALLNGLTLYLAPKEKLLNPGLLKKIIVLNNITIIWLTAPLFNQVVQSGVDIFTGLRNLLVGGDVLSPPHINQVRRRYPRLNIINGYGPTENTTFSTTFLIEREYTHIIPIGKPIANSTAYIVDKNNHLLPIGTAGELWVGGDGVSRGYLNNPELTAEKFGHDLWDYHNKKNKSFLGGPGGRFFKKAPLAAGGKLYKTGDLTRWLPHGHIEFLGRIDQQVKIRGFRIEPKEIEYCLLNQDHIIEAVVQVRTDETGEKYLCAYLVSHHQVTPSELRKNLSADLPDYMIPSYFVMVEKVPLTSNGKVDWRALPEPVKAAGHRYLAPRDAIEEKLVEIWTEVLGGRAAAETPGISVDANFFELGGHSLKAALLMAKIHKTFDVNIPLTKIFTTPTIRELAAYLKEAAEDKYIPIPPTEKKEYYVVSSAQKRLYVLQQMDEGEIAYNMPYALMVEGHVDKDRLENTFKQLIRRHESFRTSFMVVDEKPMQRIHEEVEFEVEYHQLSKEAKRDGGREEKIIQDFVRTFNLSQAPLLRVGIIDIHRPNGLSSPDAPTAHKRKNLGSKYILMVDMHHIISDGTSIKVFIKDFISLYGGDDLLAPGIQYKDFSEWQNSKPKREKIKLHGEYWQKQFEVEIPALNLPIDYLRPVVQCFEGNTLRFEMGEEETWALKTFALEEGVTLFILLLSIYTIFLSKLSNQQDLVVGTPVFGRKHVDLENIIGMFVNTLALRNFPRGERTFRQFLEEVKDRALEGFAHQDYPYEELVEVAAADRNASRNPLFDNMFALQNYDVPGIEIPGLKLTPYDCETRISKFDLTLLAMESKEELIFTFEYSKKLFKKATIGKFIQYFKNIVSLVLVQPGEKISGIEIISDREKRRILFDFNNTDTELPGDKTFCHLFAEQVKKAPDSAALVYEDQCITYCEASETANRLAHQLEKQNIRPDAVVAITVRPSIEMITALLGILKASAAFLPIDPDYPEERIQYMLTDSSVGVLLTTPKLQVKVKASVKENSRELRQLPLQFINIETKFAPAFEPLPSTSTSTWQVSPTNLAYVIYTSGSTGRPKGVLVNHRSLNNLCHWHNKHFSVTANDRAFKYANFGFDASVWEIFPYLIIGASLYIPNDDIKMDIFRLNEYLENNCISIGFLPTQICEQFMTLSNRSLRVLLTGGDQLKSFIKRNYQLVNNYGPTENTVVSTSFVVESSYPNIPIGKPLDNVKLYILDKHDHVQPLGIPGELVIAGAGVARGYLNRPGLTAEQFKRAAISHSSLVIRSSKFFPNDRCAMSNDRLYKTGDLARWLPGGNIEFLGRIDHQVKIRGFRIELGEIESQLERCDQIKKAIVLAKEDKKGEKFLCAYFVGINGASISISELRMYLSQQLPDYMIPVHFVSLDKVPFTPGGKLDRKALPTPELVRGEDQYVAPQNPVETKLVEIWSKVLEIEKEKIGVHDNFFQIGGHSLRAVALIARIHKELEVNVPLTEIFRKPTVRELSRYIKHSNASKYISIKPLEKKTHYELSSAQKRIYLLQQKDLMRIDYNMTGVFTIEGSFKKKKVEQIFSSLILRHEALRTSFCQIDEGIVQKIDDEVTFSIHFSSISSETHIKNRIKKFIKPFDLSQAPLLRVEMIQVEEQKHYILYDLHHIISDGISMKILEKDFISFWEGKSPGSIHIHYRDYTVWQNQALKTQLIKQELYWLNRMKGFLFTRLPADKTDYSEEVEGKKESRRFDKDVYKEIEKFCDNYQVTRSTFLISIFNIILALEIGQMDITIGMPFANRKHYELGNIIGIFLNILLIRTVLEPEDTFPEVLTKNTKTVLEAVNNSDYPYELLSERIRQINNLKHPELFSISYNYLPDKENIGKGSPDFRIKPVDIEEIFPKIDMTLYIRDTGNDLKLDLVYKGNRIDEYRVKRIMDNFSRINHMMLTHKNTRIKDINLEVETISYNPFQLEMDGAFNNIKPRRKNDITVFSR